MTVPRLLRSRRAWLFLAGLVFLAAAWIASMYQGRGFGWGSAGFGAFLAHGNGSLRCGVDNGSLRTQGYDTWNWDPRNEGSTRPAGDPIPRWRGLPPPHLLMNHGDTGMTRVMLPHWLLITLYLGGWAALAWHRRRWLARHAAGPVIEG